MPSQHGLMRSDARAILNFVPMIGSAGEGGHWPNRSSVIEFDLASTWARPLLAQHELDSFFDLGLLLGLRSLELCHAAHIDVLADGPLAESLSRFGHPHE